LGQDVELLLQDLDACPVAIIEVGSPEIVSKGMLEQLQVLQAEVDRAVFGLGDESNLPWRLDGRNAHAGDLHGVGAELLAGGQIGGKCRHGTTHGRRHGAGKAIEFIGKNAGLGQKNARATDLTL
jgi:hypothetical protein